MLSRSGEEAADNRGEARPEPAFNFQIAYQLSSRPPRPPETDCVPEVPTQSYRGAGSEAAGPTARTCFQGRSGRAVDREHLAVDSASRRFLSRSCLHDHFKPPVDHALSVEGHRVSVWL